MITSPHSVESDLLSLDRGRDDVRQQRTRRPQGGQHHTNPDHVRSVAATSDNARAQRQRRPNRGTLGYWDVAPG